MTYNYQFLGTKRRRGARWQDMLYNDDVREPDLTLLLDLLNKYLAQAKLWEANQSDYYPPMLRAIYTHVKRQLVYRQEGFVIDIQLRKPVIKYIFHTFEMTADDIVWASLHYKHDPNAFRNWAVIEKLST